LLGIIAGYIIAWSLGILDLSSVEEASWMGLQELYAIRFDWSSILMLLPAAFVLFPEHIGHLLLTSKIVGNDLTIGPGLGRSFIGNGVSTLISSFVGSTPNTTYGENIGVLAITRVYSTFVIGIAAVMAIVLSFISKLAALIQSIPTPV